MGEMRRTRKHADLGEPVLVAKHSLAIRWFHWINFPVLTLMVWSGLLIFWANRSGAISRFGQPVFPESFFAPRVPDWFPALPKWLPDGLQFPVSHGHREFYELDHRLAEGQGWHFTFMWLFALNGVAYVGYLVLSGEWRVIVPRLRDLKTAVLVALSDLHLVREPEREGTYNAAQRIAYTGVILLGLVMLVSGFAIYKPTQAFWLANLFGGYVMARWFHFWTTMLLCAFFVVHVAQVARAGWNNFRSMITGFALEYRARSVDPEPTEAPEEAA